VDVSGSVALVTGANRGLGRAFVEGLLAAGAATVYAGVRDLEAPLPPGAVAVPLDITDPSQVAAAVDRCADVDLLVNNAGIATRTGVLAEDALEQGRREMEVNAFGTLAVSQAFAPVLARNGGGAIVNVLSVLSWLSMPPTAMYAAAKAASWSLTNSLRLELREQGTAVVAVHCAFLDTDMARGVDLPKLPPEEVVAATLQALALGLPEVLADDTTRSVRAALSSGLAALYPAVAS
jgi:NAD(P)-dependent dehydrogenase (short-subunit alcohol dehydrogenase family)